MFKLGYLWSLLNQPIRMIFISVAKGEKRDSDEDGWLEINSSREA